MKSKFLVVLMAFSLAGCVTNGQSRYNYDQVGRASVVEFGTVLASRPIDITGKNTGAGSVIGGTTGGLIGTQIGQGNGGIAGVVGGVIVGAVIGGLAEQAAANRTGIEYTVVLQNGKVLTLAQEQQAGDRVFENGERVMVQANGSYQRVLPTSHIPTEVNRPVGITVKD